MNRISRREFLEGASAALVAPAPADGSRYTLRREAGVIYLERENVVIWTLDPALLQATEIRWPFGMANKTIALEEPVKVTIAGAWHPSRMRFDLVLAFEKLGQAWHVSANWHFKSFNLTLKSDPVALRRIELDRLRATVRGAQVQKILKEATGGAVHGPNRAALCIDRQFQVSLDAGPNHFSVLDGTVSLQRLMISYSPNEAIISVESEARAQDIAIGVHKATSLTLTTAGKLKVGIHYKSAMPKLQLDGPMHLLVRNGRTTTAKIFCETASVGLSGADSRWRFMATEDFFRLATPYASFDVDVPLDGKTTRPIEAESRREAASHNAKLVRFDATVRVHSSTIALRDADRSRFDFGGQHLRVVLERSHRDPAKEVMWTEGYALADPHTPLVLNLNFACLRLWRGRDLFHLTYHFRDADLFISENSSIAGRPCLEKHRQLPKPTLIAEFPPQHIMERSFLRQNLELPDAGNPVSPARLRELQRLSLEEGKELRGTIQQEKKSEESKEILGFDCTLDDPCKTAAKDTTLPFADFADDWEKQEAKGAGGKTLLDLYGKWIGPDGLFIVEARRDARRFARKRRGKRRDDLIGTTGAFSPKDLANVVEMLALPAFPLSRKEAKKYFEENPPRSTSPETDDQKRDRLFEYAGRHDENFKDIQTTARGVLGHRPLLMENWPLSAPDWKEIFGKDRPPLPTAPNQTPDDDLRKLLQSQKVSESDTRPNGRAPDEVPEGFRRPVEAWISDPSRLAFRIGTNPIALSVDGLTSWDKFELRVTQRAKRLYLDTNLPPEDRTELAKEPGPVLRSQGIDSSGTPVSASVRMDAIRRTLVPPTQMETALEIPTRLILSPAQDARWITPKRLPGNVDIWNPAKDAPVPIWQARLVEKLKAPSLRAVWSPDFVKEVFNSDPKKRPNPAPEKWKAPNDEVYRTALSPFDRAELVALSSIYGLPVIASEDKERSSQLSTPEGYGVALDESDKVDKIGLFMPVALRARRLALGATGAMMDLDTTFPAVTAARIDGKPLFDSFSIQRWRSLIVDGSDVVTTVVRRGYLLPLGHTASLIKVTEPKLRPIDPSRPSAGYTVEQATRIFIEVTRATHTYPAVGQSDAARNLQPREVKLLTVRTPDLIDAADDRLLQFVDTAEGRAEAVALPLKAGPHGAVRGWINRADSGKPAEPARLAGKVLWPRTDIGPQGTVRFRMRIDGGSAPVSMPLLFVDHTAASDPETIRFCALYYNYGQDGKGDVTDKPKKWSKVLHNGALRSYADEQRQGQCTFATDWQRFEIAAGATNFKIDAALLAAEQPPLYPKMAAAQIRPQQIQGLTGSAAPALQVAYACDYVSKGFDPDSNSNNPAQDTYLVVTSDPRPTLDMGDHGDQGGTVARKAMEICGLNRRFGLAGPPVLKFDCAPTLAPVTPVVAAPPPATMPVAPAPPAPAPAPAPPAARPRTPAAVLPAAPACVVPTAPQKASYSKDFALGHFGEDCKLFGLIKLSTFIELITGTIGANVVPQLEEITSFSGAALAEFVGKISDPLGELRKKLTEYSGDLLFPGFAAALNDLQCALPGVNDADLDRQIAAATKVWSAGQRVVRELEAIARTPLGDIAERLRGVMSLPQADFAKAIGDTWRDLGDELKAEMTKAVTELADVLVTVTLSNEDEAKQVSAAVALLLANKDILTSPDPFAAIVEKIKNDPALANIANRELALVKGAMYQRLAPLFEVLHEYETAGSTAAFAAAVKIIERAIAIQKQLSELLGSAAAFCNKAFDALKEFFEAAVPDLESGIFSSVSSAAVKGLRAAAAELRKVADQIQATAGADPALIDYVRGWAQTFDGGAAGLESTFKETATARQAVIDAVKGDEACENFKFDIARRFAVLQAARQRLFAAWLQAVSPPPAPAPSSLPANLAALWQKAAAQIAATVREQLQTAVDATLAKVASAGSTEWTKAEKDLKEVFDALPADLRQDFAFDLSNVKSKIDTAKNSLLAALQPPPATATPDDMAKWAANAKTSFKTTDDAIRSIEAAILDAALRMAMANIMKFAPDLSRLVTVATGPAIAAYQAMEGVRREFYESLKPANGSRAGLLDLLEQLFGLPDRDCNSDWVDAVLLVNPDGKNVCTIDNDALIGERKLLQERTIVSLTTVLQRWGSKQSAPQLIAGHIEHFVKLSVHANILKVFDVEQLRRDLMDALSSVLPTTRRLNSTLDLPLSTTSVGLGTFRPKSSHGKLKLDTSATINLLNLGATPRVEFSGIVDAFELDILSIMTFSFRDGVKYTKSISDGRGSITAPLGAEDIKFGDKLSFLADLSRSLSFGGDDGEDGPYTIVHIDNPSIEAGYRIGIPVITLGVTFTNIHFSGAVMLPFNSGSARLRAALGSLDAPFMISAGIYGGSGFMGIEASPHGIEAFEASFEFGGICSIGYGPLQGTAYVTTGAYVRKDGLGCTFAALFSAGFTAHIACFGISAAFTLRLYKRDGASSVEGEAQLTFTFSVGFAKVHYTIRVTRTMQAGFGGGGQQAASNLLPGGVQIAALGGFTPDCFPVVQKATLTTESLSPAENWSEFEAQFDQSFYPRFAA